MPPKREDIPSTLTRSAQKVQDAYEKTLESAEETYGDEERAHRTAWSSVKQIAEKKGDHWELKDETGASDAGGSQAAGGIDTTKTKDELLDDAREAGIAGRSKMTKDVLIEALQKHSERETAKARG